MGKLIVAAVVLGAGPVGPAWAQKKDCDELKAEIEAKIKKNGVDKFTLDVVDADEQADGKVVGTCDGGTKKIVYKTRLGALASAATAAARPAPRPAARRGCRSAVAIALGRVAPVGARIEPQHRADAPLEGERAAEHQHVRRGVTRPVIAGGNSGVSSA